MRWHAGLVRQNHGAKSRALIVNFKRWNETNLPIGGIGMKLYGKKSFNEEYYELDNIYNETDDRHYSAMDSSIWYN